MVKIVIIQKGGECKTHNLKNCVFSELHKKCGFKNDNNFSKRMTWKIEYKNNNLFVNLFAKDNGRATTENKFDLPPPIDNNLYFGNMAIVACTNTNSEENSIDFDVDMWCKIYESLMGGFEDITNTDDEEEEEEYVPPELLTKQGYKKDGFIVSDDDDEEEEDDDDDDDDDDEDDDDDDEEEDDNDDDNDDDDEDEDNDNEYDIVDNEAQIIALNNIKNEDNVVKRKRRKKQQINNDSENEDESELYLQEEKYCEE